tara:strand:- start:335 stop:787 length:453 start_codon:yes stop_codon:yes gene_type:complete
MKHILSSVIFVFFIIIAFGSTDGDNVCSNCSDVQYSDNLEDVKDAYDDSLEEIQEKLESLCDDFISRDRTWQDIKLDFGFLSGFLTSIESSYPYNNYNLHPEEQEEAVAYYKQQLKKYPDLQKWRETYLSSICPCAIGSPVKPNKDWQKR